MPFVPKSWLNSPSTSTPISAAALQDMETRLSDYTDDRVDPVESDVALLEAQGGQNVKAHGAAGSGTADQTTYFTAARDAAGVGGTIIVPPGTYYLKDFDLLSRQTIVGVGTAAILAPRPDASYVMRASGVLQCEVKNVLVDGISLAGVKGIVLTGSAIASSQGHKLERVRVVSCATGVSVEQGATSQVDKNTYVNCEWADNTTHLRVNSVNAQEQVLVNCTFNGGTTGIQLTAGTVDMLGGQFQSVTTALLIDGANAQWVHWVGVITEGTTTDIDGNTFWPSQDVILEQCILQSSTNHVRMGQSGAHLYSVLTRYRSSGQVRLTGTDTTFHDYYSTFLDTADILLTGTSARRHKHDREGTWHQGASGDAAVKVGRAGDTDPRAAVTEAGFRLGSGSGATDILWSRSGSAATLLNALLKVTGNLNVNDAIYLFSTGKIGLDKVDGTGFIEFREQSPEPSAPSANYAALYVKDNGAGKTQLCVRFATGAVQVIATEP